MLELVALAKPQLDRSSAIQLLLEISFLAKLFLKLETL
jgi:hypothetical protein